VAARAAFTLSLPLPPRVSPLAFSGLLHGHLRPIVSPLQSFLYSVERRAQVTCLLGPSATSVGLGFRGLLVVGLLSTIANHRRSPAPRFTKFAAWELKTPIGIGGGNATVGSSPRSNQYCVNAAQLQINCRHTRHLCQTSLSRHPSTTTHTPLRIHSSKPAPESICRADLARRLDSLHGSVAMTCITNAACAVYDITETLHAAALFTKPPTINILRRINRMNLSPDVFCYLSAAESHTCHVKLICEAAQSNENVGERPR